MAWRDRLQRASFKGVEFWVESASSEKGRRVAVHTLAGSDRAVLQDLGRSPDALDVEAFLWGDDFDRERDALEEILADPGAGPLVLPTRGELWARVVRGPVTSERRNEYGYCTVRFSVVVEDRDAGRLRVTTDTSGELKVTAAAVSAAAQASFEATFDASGMPDKYLSSTRTAITDVTAKMRTVQRDVQSALGEIDDVTSAIDELDSAANALLSTPSALASRIIDLVGTVFGLADTVDAGIDRVTGLPNLLAQPFERSTPARATRVAASSMAGLGADAPETSDTALGQRAADNTRAVYWVARAAALARQSETYADAPLDSSTLALAIIEEMGAEVDGLQGYGVDDTLFQALSDLRAAATDHLTQTASDLPRAVTYDPPQEVPAILIAHTWYGDARQEAEIVARNLPPHPLFVSGPIEVLE